MKFSLIILFVLGGLFAFNLPSGDTKLVIRVRGHVLRDRDNNPVQRASITLFLNGRVTTRTMTNINGKFELQVHDGSEPDSIVCEAVDYVPMNLPFRAEGGFLQLYLSDNKQKKLKHKAIEWLEKAPESEKGKPKSARRGSSKR